MRKNNTYIYMYEYVMHAVVQSQNAVCAYFTNKQVNFLPLQKKSFRNWVAPKTLFDTLNFLEGSSNPRLSVD